LSSLIKYLIVHVYLAYNTHKNKINNIQINQSHINNKVTDKYIIANLV
jgi:hypothetical protein